MSEYRLLEDGQILAQQSHRARAGQGGTHTGETDNVDEKHCHDLCAREIQPSARLQQLVLDVWRKITGKIGTLGLNLGQSLLDFEPLGDIAHGTDQSLCLPVAVDDQSAQRHPPGFSIVGQHPAFT
jgi:hypothetical protein